MARNRFVLRAHERLLREMNRQKDDDRTRRMEALKVFLVKVSMPHPLWCNFLLQKAPLG